MTAFADRGSQAATWEKQPSADCDVTFPLKLPFEHFAQIIYRKIHAIFSYKSCQRLHLHGNGLKGFPPMSSDAGIPA